MTGYRLQIRTERHGQILGTTVVRPQPGRRPSGLETQTSARQIMPGSVRHMRVPTKSAATLRQRRLSARYLSRSPSLNATTQIGCHLRGDLGSNTGRTLLDA